MVQASECTCKKRLLPILSRETLPIKQIKTSMTDILWNINFGNVHDEKNWTFNAERTLLGSLKYLVAVVRGTLL